MTFHSLQTLSLAALVHDALVILGLGGGAGSARLPQSRPPAVGAAAITREGITA